MLYFEEELPVDVNAAVILFISNIDNILSIPFS